MQPIRIAASMTNETICFERNGSVIITMIEPTDTSEAELALAQLDGKFLIQDPFERANCIMRAFNTAHGSDIVFAADLLRRPS